MENVYVAAFSAAAWHAAPYLTFIIVDVFYVSCACVCAAAATPLFALLNLFHISNASA